VIEEKRRPGTSGGGVLNVSNVAGEHSADRIAIDGETEDPRKREAQ
jgi:DNA-binding protein YbaB